MRGGDEAEIDRLPIDLLAHIFSLMICFKDLAQWVDFFLTPKCFVVLILLSKCIFRCIYASRVSRVCRKWKQGVEESLARRDSLSFSGWKADDESTTRLVLLAYGLKELDMYDVTSHIWFDQIIFVPWMLPIVLNFQSNVLIWMKLV